VKPAAKRRGIFVPAVGFILTVAGWVVMWRVVSFWNPIAFASLWTGAAVLMWWASRSGYPGSRRHLALALVSIPLWWWFELVNARTENWSYVNPFSPSPFWYALLSSIAFATVVPAITAATTLVRRFYPGDPALSEASKRFAWSEIGAGIVLQALVFALPRQMYPFVWVAPFLLLDGVGVLLNGRGLGADLVRGRWREAAVIATAGLLCGVLWEYWNYWAVPSWKYSVPLLGFLKVFEMPLLGYLGYIPFAWSIVRLVDVLDTLWARRATGSHDTSGQSV
jgi:hypothetical protein